MKTRRAGVGMLRGCRECRRLGGNAQGNAPEDHGSGLLDGFQALAQEIGVSVLAKGCCETPNFGNWWFEPVFLRRMALEGVGFGVAGVTAGPATRKDRDRCGRPMSPPAGRTSIDQGQCTAEDQRLPRSSASRRLHASDN